MGLRDGGWRTGRGADRRWLVTEEALLKHAPPVCVIVRDWIQAGVVNLYAPKPAAKFGIPHSLYNIKTK